MSRQERVGVDVVEPVIDLGHRDRGQRGGGAGVEADQVAQPERGAAQRENQSVPRRSARQSAEGVAPARRVDQRVVLDRAQPSKLRIGAAQQLAQVVVLPEECVEAAVHREPLCRRPAARSSRRPGLRGRLLPFHDVDADAALGQAGGRGQSGDARADDHGVRTFLQLPGVRQTRGRRVRDAARILVAVGVHGASPRTCARYGLAIPATVSLCTPTKPASASRVAEAGDAVEREHAAPQMAVQRRCRGCAAIPPG